MLRRSLCAGIRRERNFFLLVKPSLVIRGIVLFVLLTVAASAQTTIVHDDFEDGTLQNWIPRGTAILTNSTEQAYGGAHSLKTTGRTAGFHGPSVNLVPLLQ